MQPVSERPTPKVTRPPNQAGPAIPLLPNTESGLASSLIRARSAVCDGAFINPPPGVVSTHSLPSLSPPPHPHSSPRLYLLGVMSSLGSAASIEVADCLFCANHKLEVCRECEFDGREDNDFALGFDPSPERGSLELAATTTNKDGEIVCKKHANVDCKQCYNWKKQLTKLHKDAKKAK
ncbi:hypothetical protein RhiJN_10252 [Ceratobasidium sp. AG-Ba]|nr:hypothetical protein RhiJN_10252 [Ceratobasidium sp. AG-Ba]QRW11005.1 hypothetical protein RhiLY_10004 [Ceratobasidium sp. AG-Ba]